MISRHCVVAVLLAHVLSAACSPPRATLLTDLPEPTPLGAEVERYALGPENTEVEAEISAAATFTLSFTRLAGALEVDPADPRRSRLELVVDMTSAESSIDRVAEIAKSDHFLDVTIHPDAAFTSRALSESEGELSMVGELTLHGVTRGLRMPIEARVEACAIDYEVAFSFDRHAFDIETVGTLESVVADIIAVRFDIHVERPCGQ